MKKTMPIGYEDIREIIDKDLYYVDKSMMIKELLDNGGKVNLFTRPRRFGKTLNMSMIRRFFELELDESGSKCENGYIFDHLLISGSGDRYLSKKNVLYRQNEYFSAHVFLQNAPGYPENNRAHPTFSPALGFRLQILNFPYATPDTDLSTVRLLVDRRALFIRHLNRICHEQSSHGSARVLRQCHALVFLNSVIGHLQVRHAACFLQLYKGCHKVHRIFCISLAQSLCHGADPDDMHS